MKKVKKLTIILTIVLLCLVSFAGIYIQKQGIIKNIVKDYDLGMNLEGYREVRMVVAEKQEVTSEKIQDAKELIKKRVEELGAEDYLIKVNYTTGEIVLELEETTQTDRVVADVYAAGKIKMVDSEDDSKVYMTNDDIKNVSLKYSTTESGTGIYLDLEFTEEGAKIIEDLSTNAYKTIEKEESKDDTTDKATDEAATTTENATTETNEKEEEKVAQPKLALMMDGTELVSSSFDTPITGGRLQLSLNSATTDSDSIQEAVNMGVALVAILNNGPLPLEYKISSNAYVYSEITEQVKMVFVIGMAVLVLIAFIVLIAKYKMSAVLAGISYIGFVALYLLVLRYANVVISLEGIAGIIIILIINYLLTQRILANSSVTIAFKEMVTQLIPVAIVIIAFSFIGWTSIASFGMTMFWGIVLTAIYHFIITKALLEK